MVNIIHLNTLLGIMIILLNHYNNFPQMTGYINKLNEHKIKNKNKNKNAITMSLKVKDKKILKNYNKIWK